MQVVLKDECSTAADVVRLTERVKSFRKSFMGSPPLQTSKLKLVIVAETAEQSASPYVKPRETPTADDIIHIVCDFYLVHILAVKSDRRHMPLVKARHVCFYLMREMTFLSHKMMARAVRRFDHTSSIHGANKIERLARGNERLRDELEILKLKVTELLNARNAARLP